MMIDLTVKTLDSQNHVFHLSDDITVKQFKDQIAKTINIPANTQRLIYCGRVLQDEKLLSEYDVNGKVIHLVQRAPPSVTQRSSNASQNQGQSQTSGGEGGGWTQLPRIHYRQTQFHGNPMYVSSVSIPSDVLEGREWLVRPNAPNNNEVRRHITVIRQMLNQANCIIDQLDNTASAPEANLESTSSQSDETPRETSDGETDGERSELPVSGVNIALARVHNDGTLEPILVSMNAAQSSQTDQQPSQQQQQQQPQQPQDTSQQPAFNEELNSDQTETTNALTPRVLAELLEKLLTTQERLNPYIRDRLLEDRNVPKPGENAALARENQRIFDRVAKCLHFLSHAQHALSNLTIDTRQSPTVLRCRPMSINYPPMLQAGVPIQVEAHISLHGQNDNPNFEDNTSTPRTDAQSTETPTSTNAETNTSRTASSTSSQSQPASDQQNTNPSDPQQQQPPLNSPLGTLFNISNNVEVVMEMGSQFGRAWDFGTSSQNRPSNNNNMNTSTNNNNNENGSNNNNTNTNSNSSTNTTTNPNREFGDYQSWMNAQSPDTIRNFVQIIAGYIAQHGLSIPIPVPSTSTPTTQGSVRRRTLAVAFAESPNSGQNSQTRGNTETHPTTSTQTRTTPRTHMLHSRAQARGGSAFDPLLACTSYHFRRNQPSPSSSAMSTQTGQTNRSTSTQVSTQSQTTIITPATAQGSRCRTRDQLQEYIAANEPSLNESLAIAARISEPNHAISLSWLLRQHRIHIESIDSTTTSRALNLFYMIADVLLEIPVHCWTDILSGYSKSLDNALLKLCRMLPNLYKVEITPATATLIADDICSVLRPHIRTALTGPTIRYRRSGVNIEEVALKLIHKHVLNLVIYFTSNPRFLSTNSLTLLNEFGVEMVSVIGYVLKDFAMIISRFARSVAVKWRPALHKWCLHIAGLWLYHYSLKVKSIKSEYEINSLLEINCSEPATTSSDSMVKSEPPTEPMEVDTTSNDQSVNNPLLDGEEVPTTFPGHNNLLPDWVPIIARDGARQRRQLQLGLADSNSTTFSDAYLSTMPSKRRKLVEQQKPSLLVSPTPNHSVISASIERLVRESVERAGVEEVDGAIAALVAEPTVRRAFGLAIRESLVPGRFQTPDFPDPLRFPNATKFFGNPSRSPK